MKIGIIADIHIGPRAIVAWRTRRRQARQNLCGGPEGGARRLRQFYQRRMRDHGERDEVKADAQTKAKITPPRIALMSIGPP